MIDEDKIKLLLTILIFISLIIYHVMNYFFPFNSNSDVFSLYKIAQILVLIGFIFLAIYNKFLARLILGKNYIAGNYKGQSSYYISNNVDASEKERNRLTSIQFSITQSLFQTTITGKSIESESNNAVSNWHGVLYKHEHNTLYFALNVSSTNSEFGVLQLHFENSQVQGFYYSGDYESKFTYKVTASKV